MNIDLIFKIAGIGIIVAVINKILKNTDNGEYAMLTTLVGIVVILSMVIQLIGDLFENVKTVFKLY